MMSHDASIAWSAVLDAALPQLLLSAEVSAEARADILAIPEEMTMFALDRRVAEAALAAASPAAGEAYRRFCDVLPPSRPFKMEPMRSVVLRILREATLMFPGLALLEACERRARMTAGRALQHPQFKVLADAAQGSVKELLFALRDSKGLIFNQGYGEAEVVSATHVILHMHDYPWAACKYFLGGFMEGAVATFGVNVRVVVSPYGEAQSDLTLDVRWW